MDIGKEVEVVEVVPERVPFKGDEIDTTRPGRVPPPVRREEKVPVRERVR